MDRGASAAQCELRQPAREQDDHDEGADEYGRGGAREPVGDRAGELGAVALGEARLRELHAGLDDDRHDGRGGAGPEPAHPLRGVVLQRDGRDRQREDQPGEHEREPARQRARVARHAARAVDRHLRRGRAREQLAGGVGVLEVARRDPAAPLHHELAQQGDVGGRAAEADDADAAPFADDGLQRDAAHGARPY